jgi:hypothetical protein
MECNRFCCTSIQLSKPVAESYEPSMSLFYRIRAILSSFLALLSVETVDLRLLLSLCMYQDVAAFMNWVQVAVTHAAALVQEEAFAWGLSGSMVSSLEGIGCGGIARYDGN